MKDVLRYFSKLESPLILHPAGVWRFEFSASEGSYKKHALDAMRPTIGDWRRHKQDNIAKCHLGDTPYMVIDVDAKTDVDIVALFPSLGNTLTTQTTGRFKRHFYFLPPDGMNKIASSVIGLWEKIDLLAGGFVFEGHGLSLLDAKQGCYKIVCDAPPTRLTEAEYISLQKAVTLKQSKVKEGLAFGKGNKNKGGRFFIPETYKLITKYVASRESKENRPLTPRQWNMLLKLIFPSVEIKDPRRKTKLPPLSYILVNTAMYLLTHNTAIDTDEALVFISLWLKNEWGINPDSQKSRDILYRQILPNLPTHKSGLKLDEQTDIRERLDLITIGDATFLTTSFNNKQVFIVLDATTYEIRRLDSESIFINTQALELWLRFEPSEFRSFSRGIPHARLVNDPTLDLFSFDEQSHIDCYNIYRKSEYQKRATPVPAIPSDNILSKVIENYMGSMTKFYYAWLAEIVFGTTPPNTILALCSQPTDKAGTGKTTLASGIPQHLTVGAINVKPKDIKDGWGDTTRGRALISLNDMKVSKEEWQAIYPQLRDIATANQRGLSNVKYGAITTTTNKTAIAISSNDIVALEPHDRRIMVVLPASIYEGLGMLSKADGKELNRVMEVVPLEEYSNEFQELANYLLWVKSQNWYREGLRQTAPHTLGRNLATQDDSYLRRIPTLIVTEAWNDLSLMLNFATSLEGQRYPLVRGSWQRILSVCKVADGEYQVPIALLANLVCLTLGQDRIMNEQRVIDLLGLDTRWVKPPKIQASHPRQFNISRTIVIKR